MPYRYIQPLRILIQFMFLLFSLWLGVQFFRFLQFVASGGATTYASRPDGIEAFLPISGLLGFAAWIKGLGINPIHPAALVLLLTICLLSLLLRRSFCSWICPVGTISECSWKTGFKFMRRNWRLPAWLDITLRCLKYLLLSAFIYSIVIAMPPQALQDFILSDYHKQADVRLLQFFLHLSPTALVTLLVLVLLSLPLKNPFCRYLCPYGALLGLLALFSPVRVTRDKERCVSCGACSQVCPTHIDVMHKTSVASAECIGCWRCIGHCRAEGALNMRAAGKFVIPGLVFAALVVLIFLGGTMIGKVTGHWHTAIGLEEYRRLLGL